MTDLENKQVPASDAPSAAAPGTIVDRPADGIQHTAPVGVEEER